MRLGHMVLIAELALLTGTISCGANPCQDVVDAVNKATMQKGCGGDALSQFTPGFDPTNCMLTDQDAKVAEKQAACFDKVTACDTQGIIALNVCLQGAQ
jgi:hypothetical protein